MRATHRASNTAVLQLATGGSAITAIEVLKEAGVPEENILFLNVVSCPEGLRALAEKTPGAHSSHLPDRLAISTSGVSDVPHMLSMHCIVGVYC